MLKKYKDFIGIHRLVEAFEEFIKPKAYEKSLKQVRGLLPKTAVRRKLLKLNQLKSMTLQYKLQEGISRASVKIRLAFNLVTHALI